MIVPKQTSWRWQLVVAAVLSLIGLGLSLYLTRQHYLFIESGSPSACNFGGAWNCDLVSSGQYSELFGVPLSHLGTLFYLLTGLLAALGLLRDSFRTYAHGLLLVLAIPSVLVSIGLFALSTVVIRAVCLFCISMYAVNLGLLLTTLVAGRAATSALGSVRWGDVLRSPAVVLVVIGAL